MKLNINFLAIGAAAVGCSSFSCVACAQALQKPVPSLLAHSGKASHVPLQITATAPSILLPAQLTISTGENEYQPGEPVTLSITLTNNSAKSLKFFTSSRVADYVFAMHKAIYWPGSTNLKLLVPVPFTSYGEKELSFHNVRNRLGARSLWLDVAHEKPFQISVPLSRLFDMSESSTYFISVQQSVIIDGKEDYLASAEQRIVIQ